MSYIVGFTPAFYTTLVCGGLALLFELFRELGKGDPLLMYHDFVYHKAKRLRVPEKRGLWETDFDVWRRQIGVAIHKINWRFVLGVGLAMGVSLWLSQQLLADEVVTPNIIRFSPLSLVLALAVEFIVIGIFALNLIDDAYGNRYWGAQVVIFTIFMLVAWRILIETMSGPASGPVALEASWVKVWVDMIMMAMLIATVFFACFRARDSVAYPRHAEWTVMRWTYTLTGVVVLACAYIALPFFGVSAFVPQRLDESVVTIQVEVTEAPSDEDSNPPSDWGPPSYTPPANESENPVPPTVTPPEAPDPDPSWSGPVESETPDESWGSEPPSNPNEDAEFNSGPGEDVSDWDSV